MTSVAHLKDRENISWDELPDYEPRRRDEDYIPLRPVPEGTIFFSVGPGYNGNRPPNWVVTPDGRVYDDSWRGMTHGGAEPWQYKGRLK
jgi:hypothetical protein